MTERETPSPPGRTLHEVWSGFIELIAASHELGLDPQRMRSVIEREAAVDRSLSTFASVATRLGLRVTILERSAADVVSLDDHEFPLVTTNAEGGLIAILRSRSGQLRVRDTFGEEQWLAPQALAALVGTQWEGVPVPWAVAELALPLTKHAHAGPDEHVHHPSPHERVWRLIKLERGDIATIVVYAVFIGLAMLAVPIAVQALVTTVVFGVLVQPLAVLAVIVLICLGFSAMLRAMQAWVVERIQERLFVRVALELAERLPRIRAEALMDVLPAERVNRFFDVVGAQKALASLAIDGLFLSLQAGLGMVLLAFYHPALLAFDMALLVGLAIVVFGFGRRGVSTSLAESAAKYQLAAWLQDVARNPTAFRLHPAAAVHRTDDLARAYISARRAHFRIVFRQIVGSLALQALASTGLLAVGGWLVIHRQLTVGQLVAAEIVVTSVVSGIAKLGKHLETYYDLATSLDKIGHITDLPVEPSDGVRKLTPGGTAVSLEVAGLAYGVGGRLIQQGIELFIAPGSRVAILGTHGSGKSTLANLLVRLHEPAAGTILVDGVDLRELDPEELRRHVVLVRDAEVFEGSVYENIALGREGVGPERVHAALANVGLLGSVARLERGVQTKLLPGGSPMSLGDAHRIALARALAGSPRLLLVDGLLDGIEPTVLDALEECLAAQCNTTTVVVLTSDPVIAKWCQRTVTLSSPRSLAAAGAASRQAPDASESGGVQ